MPKKIIQISPYSFDHPGGVEQYARTLQGLFPNEMITLAGGEDFPIVEPVSHFPLPAFWRRGFWKVFSRVHKDTTSLIISHIRFSGTTWLAYLLAKSRGIPYVHIEHGTGYLVHKNPLIALVAKMVDLTIGRHIIRHADRVITVSEAGKKWVSETFGREDITVIYRGFEFPTLERVANDIPKIGFVGRLTGLKNVTGLIEALSEIRDEKWTCEIVGDGEERENLEALVKSLELEGRVNFIGARPHDWIMREFYPRVNIFVNPSLQEGLPTTVIEALGMGCAVIATDVGGTREIGGITLIRADNVGILGDAIVTMLHHLGKPSDHLIYFSRETMAEKYSTIFGEYGGCRGA